MKQATLKVFQDLRYSKHFHEVNILHNDESNFPYLIAQEFQDSLKLIVFACDFNEEISHLQLTTIFNSLSPPGDLYSYEAGLLLAIVGSSSSVVYHRIMQGICNILPLVKEKEKLQGS